MPTVPQYQRQSQTQTAPVMTSNLRIPENSLVQGILQAADMSINMIIRRQLPRPHRDNYSGLFVI
ncbi:hypothetical protein VI618_21745 [Klebsiella pneumoniae]|uniref:hypothetical protein n=1 Tax=Klebsiella pneumoniae TaxID=573 RepID=UPI002D77702B|nr:hypothetical protein [Klebsiella pneumoniae]WRT34942.1 hypothetical protein VI618_21745 [Klebsiella pneumoniae]